ncbi:MAG: 2-amino-4-hydroxy-6-hydroxymethyldihydropteridine pyrophosphokinase [Chromatiaceae bacterium]|nr:2-amino-4-hydroxy-6-hydroxymethyldihydropteridine pyrophosphokinase [Chromatiaceae bacterium]
MSRNAPEVACRAYQRCLVVTAGVGQTPVVAYVGLGSNLSNPESQVRQAMTELGELPGTELVARSAMYRTAPVGPTDQPDYVNAVVRLTTRLSPRGLLDELQLIEQAHGRRRDGTRWGPRTLDLDVLLYGDERLDEPGLQIPHPEMGGRAFVLVPLADVAPGGLQVPGVGSLVQLLERCPCQGVTPLVD